MRFAARRAMAVDATAPTFGMSDGIVACMIEAALTIAFSFARIKEPEMSDNLGISIRKGYAIGCKVMLAADALFSEWPWAFNCVKQVNSRL